jgi:hypothetical protein
MSLLLVQKLLSPSVSIVSNTSCPLPPNLTSAIQCHAAGTDEFMLFKTSTLHSLLGHNISSREQYCRSNTLRQNRACRQLYPVPIKWLSRRGLTKRHATHQRSISASPVIVGRFYELIETKSTARLILCAPSLTFQQIYRYGVTSTGWIFL